MPLRFIDGLGRLLDANETLTNVSQNPVAHLHKYGYDALSQLVDANISNIGGGNWAADYSYEDNGNMVSRNQTSFTYTGNEMATIGGENFVMKLEKILGRILKPKKAGRPKNQTKKNGRKKGK